MSQHDSVARVQQVGIKDILQIVSVFISAIVAVYYVSGMISSLQAQQDSEKQQISQLTTEVQSVQTLSYTNNASIASLQQGLADMKAQPNRGSR
jgi:flagellar basal body-associated protein FliL